jgi:glycerophosphoryl diester phosphodiesterase
MQHSRIPLHDYGRAVIAVLGAACCACMTAPKPDLAPLPKSRWLIVVIGHRAGAAIAPENTLAAIRNAIELRADYVELDIRTTKDGEFVIMHDSTVDRTTSGHGAVKDLTLAEIKGLGNKNRFDKRYDGEHVPTFDEALAMCRGKVNLYLDHKDADTAALVKLLRKNGMDRNTLVYNGPDGIKAWKRLAPDIPVMPSLPKSYRRPGGIALFEADCHTEALDGHISEWTTELIADAHAKGVKVYVDIMGAMDNPEGYAKEIDLGVDGIQTDYPDRLTRFLTEHPGVKRADFALKVRRQPVIHTQM